MKFGPKRMLNAARLITASVQVFRDPTRLDAVLKAADELFSAHGMDEFLRYIDTLPEENQQTFKARTYLHLDLTELRALPEGTLGRAVADHCDRNGIDPSAFVDRPVATPADWIHSHLEKSHDVLHAVTGFESDKPGELGLQAFYLAQMPATLGLLILGIANFRLLTHERELYPRVYDLISRGWLMGKRARPLFGIDWASQWERPLAEVRRELGIDTKVVDEFVGVNSVHFVPRTISA